jgi:hypothetical protein
VLHATVMALLPVPAVSDPPAETVHVYPVIPAVVEYTLPVEFTHADAGPAMTGVGKALTVTLYTVGAAAVQLLPFV